MNKKIIVILKYSFDILGGTEVVAIKLAKELSNYHNVHVVSIATSIQDNIYDLDNIPFYNIFDKKIRVRNAIVSGSKRLREYVLNNSIDIVFSIGVHSNAIMLLSTLFTDVKTINCDHMTIHHDYGNKFYALQRFLGANFSDKSVVLTEENKKGYIDKYNIPSSKVEVIYNWIDNIGIQESIDIKSNKIITVGRLEKVKGYDLLKLVSQKIYQKHPNWTWDIYGEGKEEITNDLKALSNINLKGLVKGVERIYPGHSIYVMTSYFEGLPLVLLEAKKFGLPIVSFDCPTGPSEIIRDGINGFLVKNYDINEMAEKISCLIENQDLRKSFSDNAKLDVEKFAKDVVVAKWLELIEDL
ncbi:glycosyltransferase family 4 protein [Actinobacillus equuli subsp. equuli]|uniref:glycosyltransferase family 4 protein n=1 Tax=Actinobacillus equuli TaxID=718 RepID=UPI002441D03E|nr:glycosyltransferase family 4 protein [Actinobacillus equuli]WGE44340.1 glycosyltransferase family 4 protein [Actinobacillus equuli subsp. equuli]